MVVEVLAHGLVGAGFPRRSGGGTASDREASYRLFRVLDRLRERFGGRVVVHLIEPLSLAWVLRVIRHRPRRYPAFIVEGRRVISGDDETAIADQIQVLLGSAPAER